MNILNISSKQRNFTLQLTWAHPHDKKSVEGEGTSSYLSFPRPRICHLFAFVTHSHTYITLNFSMFAQCLPCPERGQVIHLQLDILCNFLNQGAPLPSFFLIANLTFLGATQNPISIIFPNLNSIKPVSIRKN